MDVNQQKNPKNQLFLVLGSENVRKKCKERSGKHGNKSVCRIETRLLCASWPESRRILVLSWHKHVYNTKSAWHCRILEEKILRN